MLASAKRGMLCVLGLACMDGLAVVSMCTCCVFRLVCLQCAMLCFAVQVFFYTEQHKESTAMAPAFHDIAKE